MSITIEPTKITHYDRTDAELQAFWIFCIVVAGKSSKTAAAAVNKMFKYVDKPFVFLRALTNKERLSLLKSCRTGQYNRINNAITDSLHINLRSCSLVDLERIRGVGRKTARFFLLHSRGEEHVVLDVHILSYLRDNGIKDAPKQTPQSDSKYSKLSKDFERISSKEFPNMSLANRDLTIWRRYSGN